MAKKIPAPQRDPRDKVNRANQVRRDKDTIANFNIGLYDIDETIKYYFDEVIKPQVKNSNGETQGVPIIYGDPQRWQSVQKSGFYRDKDGKIQLPLIMYKRTGIAKVKELSRHFDNEENNLYYSFENNRTQINRYDNFSVLIGAKPVKERYKVVVPDYLDMSYECIIWTDLIVQMNKIIESIQYADNMYWGNPERFKFIARLGDFTNTVEVSAGDDRLVKTTFSIDMRGYVIPEALQKKLRHASERSLTKRQLVISEVIVSDINNLPVPGE